MQHTAYVSHVHTESLYCYAYVSQLRALGFDIWCNHAKKKNDELITDEMGEKSKKRTAFIVLLSPTAVASGRVKLEIATFLSYWTQEQKTRLVLPVILKPCEIPSLLNGFDQLHFLINNHLLEEIVQALSGENHISETERRENTRTNISVQRWEDDIVIEFTLDQRHIIRIITIWKLLTEQFILRVDCVDIFETVAKVNSEPIQHLFYLDNLECTLYWHRGFRGFRTEVKVNGYTVYKIEPT